MLMPLRPRRALPPASLRQHIRVNLRLTLLMEELSLIQQAQQAINVAERQLEDAVAATTMIHPQVRKQLPWSAIAPIWEAVLAEYGAFERFEDSQVVGVKGTRQKTPIAQALHSKHIGTRSARPWPESRSTATVRWSGCCCRWRRPSIRSKDGPGSPGDGQNGSADICGTISAPSAHIRRRGRNRPANSRARTRPGRSGLPGARLDSGRVTETQRRLTITLPLALPADAAKATLSYIVI